MQKILIDTDPGIDDAQALCYAFAHPELEVVALTTIFGNVEVNLATSNALRLCELCHQRIPVAKGATVPLSIAAHPVADFVHGKNGFGGISLPNPKNSPDPRSAAQLIVETIRANPGEITLVPIGPLTNIATALQVAPDIAGLVKEVVIMGGAVYKSGNVSAVAEANMWNDPHAANQVLSAAWPVTMHGLDVTCQVNMSREFLADVSTASAQCGGFIQQASAFYIDFYESRSQREGCCPHDLLAIAYVANPQWYNCTRAELAVITEGDETGRTIACAANKETSTAYATSVDATALLEDYLKVIANLH